VTHLPKNADPTTALMTIVVDGIDVLDALHCVPIWPGDWEPRHRGSRLRKDRGPYTWGTVIPMPYGIRLKLHSPELSSRLVEDGATTTFRVEPLTGDPPPEPFCARGPFTSRGLQR
jgi:hypothetical protein